MSATADLLSRLAADRAGILAAIAADVGEPPTAIEPALDRHLELVAAVAAALAASPGRAPATDPDVARVLARLRADGAAAARAGEPLGPLLDRHLSAGWVVWAAAAGEAPPDADPAAAAAGEPPEAAGPRASAAGLAALGTALLRAADLAAAAIAEGHGETQRERAARSAAALRELLDALVEPPDDDPGRDGRLAREALAAGIDPSRPLAVTAAWLGAEVDDGDERVGRVARALARPARAAGSAAGTDPLPLVATRRGRLLVVDAADRRADRGLIGALDAAAPGAWTAVTGGPALRLGDVAAVASDVLAALAVAVRLPRARTVQPVEALALERALLADEARLRAALVAELGPLEAAPRTGGELVETLDAFLAARMSVTGAARLLHVAPRTLAYRLERIEAIRGRPLDAAAWQRYAVLLLARRLLAAPGSP